MRYFLRALFVLAVCSVIGILVWQGVTANGNPDPTTPNSSPTVAVFDIGVLVFREGLECILVLTAITASMIGDQSCLRRPVALGAAVAFVATIITWFMALGVMSELIKNVSALNLQAGTGLLAVVVLLVIMNWFFHKIYWGGWISAHNRKKKELLKDSTAAEISRRRLQWGLGLLGFTSLYREGFEVVLFLQTYHLNFGGVIVGTGTVVGLVLTVMVAIIAFVLQKRLPYRKMLVVTGVMLGVVLLVMVGEEAQEMQLANWITTTKIPWLEKITPDWTGLWFSVFPTVETLVAQFLAAFVVIGSYYGARRSPAATPRGEPA